VTDSDVDFMFFLGSAEENIVRWRLRGRTANPQTFQQFLWGNSDVQFLICRHGGEPIGHVCTYHSDESSGTTKVAAVLIPKVQRRAWPLEGIFLFLDYVFASFPFRKVYFEVPGFNEGNFGLFLERFTTQEGRLVDAVFTDGRYWDLSFLTMTREDWMELKSSSWGRLLSRGVLGSVGADDDEQVAPRDGKVHLRGLVAGRHDGGHGLG